MDTLFPIALIESIQITPFDRILKDEFESGGSSTRSLWPAGYFRRKLSVTTSPLSWSEFRHLRSFFTRKGTNTPFIFRDNVGRTGNIQVRFAGNFPQNRDAATYQVRFELEETAPTRAQIEREEITLLTAQPILWYDANQMRHLYHQGEFVIEQTVWDAAEENYPLTWQSGGTVLDDVTALHQGFELSGTSWAKSAATITDLAAGKPPCTLFAIIKAPTSAATKKILLQLGTMGDGNGIGLALAADNYFEPYMGGSEVFVNARAENTIPGEWLSVAVLYYDTLDIVRIAINGINVGGADNPTRNYVQGPISFGAAVDGTLKCDADTVITHAILLPIRLGPAQLEDLHNLFAPQFGLPTI